MAWARVDVERRQEVDDRGGGGAQGGVAEQQDRPEGRIGLDAEIELERRQRALHALHQQPLDRRVGGRGRHLLQHVPAAAQQ